jgi:hypothetical protein
MQGRRRAIGIAVTAVAIAAAASAETDAERAQQDRIADLEQKVDVLTEELAQMRTEQVVSREGELESFTGLGPAASRIYGLARGLSIGGYAEGYYNHFAGDENADPRDNYDLADALRTVLYVGYKFNEQFVFNSEIEFEHATTGENLDGQAGEVSVEFAALDWRLREWANLRTGLVLVPMGFVNEVHEPPFFHGVLRPEVETRIIPTTWRENGVGVYGRLGETLEYRGYVVTGLDARGVQPNQLRGARGDGNRARAEDVAGVLRVDWTPPWVEGALLGGSLYSGGMDQDVQGFSNANLTLWELHAQYRRYGLELRGLVTQALVSGAADLTRSLRAAGDIDEDQTIAHNWLGWYVEAAYDVMPWIAEGSDWYLAPFVRYEWYDTQYGVPNGDEFSADRALRVSLWTPGITFKPNPNVVFKLNYRNFDPAEGGRADEVQVGFGVAF